MPRAALIYSEVLAKFDYGDDHPFKPVRARNTMEMCNRHGLLYGLDVTRPEPFSADLKDLELFHTKKYIDTLQRANSCEHDIEMLAAGIGTPDCPILPGIFDFSLRVVGATLLATQLVQEGKTDRAFNLIGGLHHAAVDHAEGFCYVNDVGIAISSLLEKGKKVAFIDIDAHHCNGVQDKFLYSPDALIISLHEMSDGFYPGTGRSNEIGCEAGKGYTVNVPLAPKTDDEAYVDTFKKVVPPLIEAFNPDIVIAEIGADTVISDPLTHLRLTSNGYEEVVKMICEFSPKLVAVGGGGYDVYRTSNCWTLAFGVMADIEPEDEYAGLVGGMMYGGEVGGLRDMKIQTKGEDKDLVWRQARKAVEYIEQTIFPIHGIKNP